MIRFRRSPRRIVVFSRRSGITLWRLGGVSINVRGHYLQLVFGDWWKANDRVAVRRREYRRERRAGHYSRRGIGPAAHDPRKAAW